MYGKQTETAIAILSRLAEIWDGGSTRISASEIAEQRGLPKAMVAKILSTLSLTGLVHGSPGPGGGYALARDPRLISLRQAYEIFEREDESSNCPFGGGVCGVGDPCALHDRLKLMQAAVRKLLDDTSFDIFRKAVQEGGLKPVARGVRPEAPRETFRAPLPRRGRSAGQ
ncbi:MAG: RrF2 family transcriptional regulator [Phycisphaerales bacterium]